MNDTTRNDELREQAIAYHLAHPEIWDLFCALAFDRIRKGFQNYSSRAIFQRIRWETAKPQYEKGEQFKIGNNITPFYARRFMRMYPKHEGFFRTRHQKSKDESATGRPEPKPKELR